MLQAGVSLSSLQVRAYLSRERFFVLGFCVLTGLLVGHFSIQQYHAYCSMVCLADPSTEVAPQAYRILMPAVEHGLIRLTGIQGAYVFGIVDTVCTALALFWLYLITVSGFAPGTTERMAVGSLLLAFAQLPITFIVHWVRPETTPTTVFVVLFVYCLSQARKHWMWTALLMGLTLAQALVRADVPFIMGFSLAALGVFGALEEWGSRVANALRGLAVMVTAGGMEVYLQYFLYPHRRYMTGSPIMLYLNVHPNMFGVMMLALLPAFFTVWLYLLRPIRLGAFDRLTILGTLIYLPVCFTVGIVREVRIYVPFLILLSAIAARVSLHYLMGGQESPVEAPTTDAL
jgi:hypothetical protein